ncbi:MAG: SDR family NAD(P)-dependent oxidoreductase [Kibdelosporangium sp.]
MSGTIAIFGAGGGLGLATAQRFAQEGFRVALIGRTQAKLDDLAGRVDGETITFATDVTDHDQLARTVARIGDIEVLAFGATGMDEVMAAALRLGARDLRFQLELRLVAPVVATQRVLPSMLARGSGTLLYATGTSAVQPIGMISNVGAASAGLRSYVHTLHEAASEKGIYAGLLMVGGLVVGSEAQARFGDMDIPTLPPQVLAQVLWDMHTGRDQVERIVTP